MTKRKILSVSFALLFIVLGFLRFTSSSESRVVNSVVLDARCEKAWHDMITLKENRYTDALLIGNMLRGYCW